MSHIVSSLFTKVDFEIVCTTKKDETLWVCGDVSSLGSWEPKKAIQLDCTHGEWPKWSISLNIPTNITISYKYFVRGPKLFKWESGTNRNLQITGVEMHVNDLSFRNEAQEIDSSVIVDEGWLNHEEFMLHLQLGKMDKKNPGNHSNGFTLTSSVYCPQLIRIKNKGGSSGLLDLPLDDSLHSFNFFSPNLEDLSIVVQFYTLEKDKRSKIATLLLVSEDFMPLNGTVTRPVLHSSGKIIGTFCCSFQVIFPFIHPRNSISALWNEHKKAPLPKLNMIGHRGCGANVSGPHSAISENTILSFLTAAQFGAEYVECDIQLTSDGIPVIHHNYETKVNGISVAINHLSFKEFVKLKPEKSDRMLRKLCKSRSFDDIHPMEKIEFRNLEQQIIHEGFASLAETLRRVPKEVGFLIEIKYPSEYCRRTRKIVCPERNEIVDAVLKVVFTAEPRKIIFISFDPNVCLLLKQKQNCFPVFFLTSILPGEVVGDPALEYDFDHWDTRCITFHSAIQFAEQSHLRGIIASASSTLLQPEVIAKAKNKGLLFCTYGKDNSNPDISKKQKELGVDALIVDNILKISKQLREKEQISNVVIADNLLNVSNIIQETPQDCT